ncbi:DUF418 domain-containing protein [Marilutibacter alkalisoli]|uniref:DUF418 domain-containing protein n=1 Tax=Marilutibacter alkalisoli TaxID=2591633 RepID=A0A514BSF7_9GAMM|nr:DUF418 domain-containing protein [Lysobacter alkalisoli]QDH70316.1 DUF418 domain-containing protein [Lysobacter alkalisoli]
MAELSQPTAGDSRLVLLDALRGFALFGVLLVNLKSLSLYGLLPKAERNALPSAAFDRVADVATSMLVDGTAITLFSILFGVGFAMQMQHAASQPGRIQRYVRRLLVLLAIGLTHAWLLWWGDILRYYAILGLALLPFARVSPRLLAVAGVVVVVALPLALQPVLPPLLPPQISSAESAAQSLAAFGSEHWSEMLEGNFARDLRMRIAVWILPAYVFGRLLVGVALGSSGMLQDPANHLRLWKWSCGATLLIAAATMVLLFLHDHRDLATTVTWLQEETGRLTLRMLRNLAPLNLALFYLSAFVLLFQRPAWRRRLAWFAPIGRMALTHYLAQTVLAIALFYGVGLGIGPRYGMAGVCVAALTIFPLQAAAGAWWLQRYRFGPAEWLWRSLTYGRMQPMRHDRRSSRTGNDEIKEATA